ncbi:hypothetical protein LJC49_01020 [Ruminococcaceae bacterium OttesenSCG-928-I18]|nr:hypothetical protein [Ruminococcaceae bacterium OttesenSCG-928-I18]
MRDKFVLFAPGPADSDRKGVVRLTPNCYEKVAVLKQETGISMGRIIEQCIDFALEHMEDDDA